MSKSKGLPPCGEGGPLAVDEGGTVDELNFDRTIKPGLLPSSVSAGRTPRSHLPRKGEGQFNCRFQFKAFLQSAPACSPSSVSAGRTPRSHRHLLMVPAKGEGQQGKLPVMKHLVFDKLRLIPLSANKNRHGQNLSRPFNDSPNRKNKGLPPCGEGGPLAVDEGPCSG